jgi:hypothetical protein
MAKKKPFVLRVSPEMMKAVEKWAADEFRSTNGQLEWIIDQALRKAGRKQKEPPPEEEEEDTE